MNEKTTRLVTAESVRAGHPDKFCDQVADAILDAHLRLDPNARVAVEVFATAGKIVVGGEITSQAKVDCSRIVAGVINRIGYMEDLALARSMLRDGRAEDLSLLYASAPDVLSELVRTALIAREGSRFIVADFSAIEARVLAWLAGEEWRLRVFREGGDIYCASASQMFHVPVEKHGLNSHLRQKGKISELALGYGGSIGALQAMGSREMNIPD